VREPTSSLLVSALFELTIFPLINGAEHLFESVNGMDERQIILSSFSSLILFMEKNAHHLQKAFERKGQDLSQSINVEKKGDKTKYNPTCVLCERSNKIFCH
jgi:hypothetical protein